MDDLVGAMELQRYQWIVRLTKRDP